MGQLSSRFPFNLPSRQNRSQQNENLYCYSPNKSFFANHFYIGGEKIDANNPEYLFGETCDLNFLSCSKPSQLPYKSVNRELINLTNSKQKSSSKSSRRISRSGRVNTSRNTTVHSSGTSNISKLHSKSSDCDIDQMTGGAQTSRPLVCLINIRKESLRLVKINSSQLENDSEIVTDKGNDLQTNNAQDNEENQDVSQLMSKNKNIKNSKCNESSSCNINKTDSVLISKNRKESENASLVSINTHNSRSSYRSLKEFNLERKHKYGNSFASNLNKLDINSIKSSDDDDDFKDALNETVSLNTPINDNVNEPGQQQSLLSVRSRNNIKRSNTIKSTASLDVSGVSFEDHQTINSSNLEAKKSVSSIQIPPETISNSRSSDSYSNSSSQSIYNIEFKFDTEVNCSITIYYFCSRETTEYGLKYKPLHPTYKSNTYFHRKGINQRFAHIEHTFQPELFDEDLLIYKALDEDGNYNSKAVFPIVIYCEVLEGPYPRQSHSLIATVEKSQMDESYFLKPLKQLIFVDGVVYILQEIFGIENKQFNLSLKQTSKKEKQIRSSEFNQTKLLNKLKSGSIQSNLSSKSIKLNSASTSSMQSRGSNKSIYKDGLESIDPNSSNIDEQDQFKSLSSERNSECVVCMSDDRDTLLLPCRHLCLCTGCARSLRYQANNCPICRASFRAVVSIQPIGQKTSSLIATTSAATTTM